MNGTVPRHGVPPVPMDPGLRRDDEQESLGGRFVGLTPARLPTYSPATGTTGTVAAVAMMVVSVSASVAVAAGAWPE
ncbi:hypothetical protein BW41_02295 [Sphingomonas sp. RIT328]|nr:hypothetical protein BW41_02295 [Sphingomonas sp. RIT328]